MKFSDVAHLAVVSILTAMVTGCAAVAPPPPPVAPVMGPGADEPSRIDFTTYEERYLWPIDSSPRDFAIDPNNEYALVTLVDGPADAITYLDLDGRTDLELTLDLPFFETKAPYALAISPEGEHFAAGWVGHAAIFEIENRSVIHALDHSVNGSRVNYSDLTFNSDGSRLIGALDNMIWWDVESGEKVRITEEVNAPQRVDVSKDGTVAFTTREDVIVRNPETDEEVCRFAGTPSAISVSPDGWKVAVSFYDDSVRVWRIVGCEQIASFSPGTKFVPHIAWMPDNEHLVTGSADGKVRIWDTSNNELVHTLDAHGEGVTGVAVSRDGHLMITVSWADRAIKLWEAELLF